jgi:hypothetical protein
VRHSLLSVLRIIVLLPSYTLVLLIRLLKWLIAPLALLAQLLIGVPLVLMQLRQPLRPRFIATPETDLPDAAWVEFADAAEALAADGFVHYGDFHCDSVIQNAVLWLRLLGQPEQGIGAVVVHIEFTAGVRPARSFVEFATEFSDGRVLSTNNLTMPYSLPSPDYLARLQLKDVWEPRAVCRLHRELVAALARPVSLAKVGQAIRDPADLLANGYAREIAALISQGWLRPDPANPCAAQLSLQGAIMGVWRQAWPLASLHLRAADRRARRLLAEHGIAAEAFAGAAPNIRVTQHTLTASMRISTVRESYDQIRALARCTDSRAELENVVVDLERGESGSARTRQFRYIFGSCADHPQRRIRRLHGFDILLDPVACTVTVSAMEREFEQAEDENEWAELSADSPLAPLRCGPWLHDLDSVLPTALTLLDQWAGVGGHTPESAWLYPDEDGAPRWQIVAWSETDQPLQVILDARSGAVLHE